MKQNKKNKKTKANPLPKPTVTKVPLTAEGSSGGSKARTILKNIQL